MIKREIFVLILLSVFFCYAQVAEIPATETTTDTVAPRERPEEPMDAMALQIGETGGIVHVLSSMGIGTDSPGDQLNITGIARIGGTTFPSPDANSVIRIPAQGTAGEHRNYIELQGVFANDATNEDGGGFIKFRTSTAANYGPEIGGVRRSGGTGDFLIKTGGNSPQERLRILDNGNVGIGTNSPGQALDVSGYARASSGFCIGGDCITSWGNAGYWTQSGSNLYPNNTGWNVGIGGITSPNTTLHVGSTSDPTTSTQAITVESRGFAGLNLIGDTDNVSGEPGGAYVYYSQDGGAVHGISGILQIAGNDPRGQSYSGTTTNSMLFGSYGSRDVHLGTNDNVRLTVTSDGNVGIGTTEPSGKLHIEGDDDSNIISFRGTSSGETTNMAHIVSARAAGISSGRYDLGLLVSTGGNPRDFWMKTTTGTLRLRTDHIRTDQDIIVDGNVGIGTTSPSAKLHVYIPGSSSGTAYEALRVQCSGNGEPAILPTTDQWGVVGASSTIYPSNRRFWRMYASDGFYTSSSTSLKSNITDIGDSQFDQYLEKVRNIRSIRFDFNRDIQEAKGVTPDGRLIIDRNGNEVFQVQKIGVDVSTLPPEATDEFGENVAIGGLQGLEIVAIKALDKKITELQAENASLRAEIDRLQALEARIEALESR
ncbi:MAG TPA: hypothetical protein ENN07_04850 [candidate division Zixibacteria bacterium]|nr:hypothetical protein [candidate division Zixibacteria bacterium]